MGIYQLLADYYDGLVKDDRSTLAWVDLIMRHARIQKVCEFACGSGEITLALAKRGASVVASDLSEAMVQKAMAKDVDHLVEWKVCDMLAYQDERRYDCVLCLCDSLNYLIEDNQIQTFIQNSYKLLKDEGTLIFDVHSLDRLNEFQDEFYEEGYLDGTSYEWSILSDGDSLYQTFVFFDEAANAHYEQHVQRVYNPLLLKQWCIDAGFSVEIVTDFVHPGICEGEKYFYICHKGGAA